jgi:cytochrome c-type biogenesis protein CcmF
MRRNGQRYGGYIVHLGMVMIGVAIIGNQFYVETTNVTIQRGESAELAGYTFTYDGLSAERQENLIEYRAYVSIFTDDGTNLLGTVGPRRNIYDKTPDMPTSEVGLYVRPSEDIYIVLNGWSENAATFSIFVNPLTLWLWVGGIVMALGTLICLWPHPKRKTATVPAVAGQPAGI